MGTFESVVLRAQGIVRDGPCHLVWSASGAHKILARATSRKDQIAEFTVRPSGATKGIEQEQTEGTEIPTDGEAIPRFNRQ